MERSKRSVASKRERVQPTERIELLSDVSGAALAGLPLEALFEEACECTGDALDHDACALLKAENAHERLLLWAAVGWPEDAIGEETVAVTEETQAGATFLRREPVIVEDVGEDPRFRESPLLRGDRSPAGITALVWGPDEPWGVLAVHFEASQRFAHDDAVFLQAIGHVLGRGVERKAAEDKLEEYAHRLERANEELEQFAHVVSHDLQEPMRNTAVFLDLFEQRYGDQVDEEGRELVHYAREGARRSQNMLEGLLRYTRIDTEEAQTQPVDTEELLDDVTDTMSARIEETDARIEHGPLPTVEADPAQLGQVLQNLLANAIKFAEPGERPDIGIEAEQLGDDWRFAVEDHGIGMDREEADELFQIFRQGEDAGDDEGAGIGLAVCQKIIQRHGGRIWVDTAPGEGATFSFTVPGVEEDPEIQRGVGQQG